MNGLLRHTGNIHIGMLRNTKSYLGVVWNNIKTGFVATANGYSGLANSVGIIKTVNI